MASVLESLVGSFPQLYVSCLSSGGCQRPKEKSQVSSASVFLKFCSLKQNSPEFVHVRDRCFCIPAFPWKTSLFHDLLRFPKGFMQKFLKVSCIPCNFWGFFLITMVVPSSSSRCWLFFISVGAVSSLAFTFQNECRWDLDWNCGSHSYMALHKQDIPEDFFQSYFSS